jgi:hypothetical protein
VSILRQGESAPGQQWVKVAGYEDWYPNGRELDRLPCRTLALDVRADDARP